MDAYRRRLAIRRDEIAGFLPGLYLTLALGGVSCITTVAVFSGWTWLADHNPTMRETTGGLLEAAAWWICFWAALTAGLLVTLWLAYRGWYALYPVQRQRETERAQREALEAARALLEEARTAGTRDRRD